MDQAQKLRDMIMQQAKPQGTSSRVITITSGKGGVGKTNFAVNLAIQFSKLNKRVIVIDADFGLANIEIVLGVIPKYSLAEVLRGEKKIDEVLTQGPMGIKFISGGSGLRELVKITEGQMGFFIENFSALDAIADIILIDTGAGISSSVINFIKASEETIIVTTAEPTSITDAYALVKTLKEETQVQNLPNMKLVINRAEDEHEASEIYEKLRKVSDKFLGISLGNLGYILQDQYLVKAVKKQEPAAICFPNSNFSKSIENIAYKLLDIEVNQKAGSTNFSGFMRRLANIFNS